MTNLTKLKRSRKRMISLSNNYNYELKKINNKLLHAQGKRKALQDADKIDLLLVEVAYYNKVLTRLQIAKNSCSNKIRLLKSKKIKKKRIHRKGLKKV